MIEPKFEVIEYFELCRGYNMTQEELDKIVERHQHWIKKDCEGWENMKSDLCGARLDDVNLRDANLRDADLCGARLDGADLREADLRGTNLCEADLRGTNLCGANLCGARLDGARLDGAEKFRLGKVLDEPMTGYKKTKEGVVITADIPKGSIVFCINGRKCRTNRAKITDMGGHEVLHSQYDPNFEYRLGQEININDFNLMYNVECASGFHFFRTREEAEEY